MNQKIIIAIILAVVLGGAVMYALLSQEKEEVKLWTTTRGETDVIRLFSPGEGAAIKSPLKVSGEARGFWFFEADFPVVLTNWDGLIIAEGFATAQGEWMTEDYVSFGAVLEFESPVFPGADEDEEHFSRRGYLILQKDNPSGLPEHDDALEISVLFAEVNDKIIRLNPEIFK